MSIVLGLVGIASAVELDPRGRWVDHAPVEVDGGSLLLRAGILFPLDDASGRAGFVFVGDAAFTAPLASPGAVLGVRAVAPEAGPRWTERVGRVVAVGRHPALLAAAELGHSLGDDPRAVSWRDAQGIEQVVVTGLRPRAALADAEAALRSRAEALGGVGLDPDRMLLLEGYRGGAPRAIVEVEPARDLRALVGAEDAAADLVRPWLTWVVDPTGVVDDRYASVLAVHGPTPDGRAWRALSGVVRDGPPEVTVDRGTGNVVLERGLGVAATGVMQVQLELTAHAPTRLLDVWIPRSETTTRPGAVPVAGDPTLSRVELRRPGVLPQPIEVFGPSFGPRAPAEGYTALTLLLPEALAAGSVRTLRIDATEDWDLGQVLAVRDWVVASLRRAQPGPELLALLQGVPQQITLGRVIAGRPVFPVLATDSGPYPTELRAGTVVGGWQLTAGGGESVPHGDGRLWTAAPPSTATFSGGDLDEQREDAELGFPAVRVLSHTYVDELLPERVRGALNFYATALPPYPYDEVVVVQAPDRPVLTVASADRTIRPKESVRDVVPTLRSLGGGQLALEGLVEVAIGAGPSSHLQRSVEDQWPHAVERALAEALASGWWEALPWSDHDRWLARALPAVYRDRFVDEAWGDEVAERWAVFTDERIAKGAPSGDLAPLAGADADWAGEVGARLLEAVRLRIGERALLEGLHRFLASGEPTLDRLVTELEGAGGVRLRETFDAFAVAGLRPRIEGTTASDGERVTVTLTATPPIGTYDVPLVCEGRRGRTVAWVRMVEGRGVATLPARGLTSVEVDPDHLLPVRGERLL